MALKPPREPLVWALFSAGGMVAALVLPALAGILWIAAPLGLLGPLDHEGLRLLAVHPVVRIGMGLLLPLFFFHWAHRFRHTLHDGLQLYHLSRFIALVTYGVALGLSLGALWILWSLG
ncbi:MAG: fumarate reductase subunit D [Gemmatimonadales bacterium]|nr:MAG: fumarate reductase subunit D [Gemmatimonadales bacterium]